MVQVNATYSTKDWNRKRFSDQVPTNDQGVKLGRVEMVHIYEGGIEAEGVLQYLFAYNDDNEGGFVGLERVTGTIEGRSGSFVLQYSGFARNERLQQTLVVIPGSGTGALSGLRGQATMECELHLDSYPVTFNFEF